MRFQAGGGPQLVRQNVPAPTRFEQRVIWGHNISKPLGTRPRLPVSGKPPFRMDVPCFTQAPPDLNGPAAAVGPPDPKAVP